MKTGLLGLTALATFSATLLGAGSASAITRDEVLVRARAYAIHEWSSTASNQAASCSAKYKSLFPTDDYVGLPYGWGGYMSLFSFDQKILQGYGAGAQETDGVLDCIAGVDCSGFVSMTWATGHYTTSSIPTTTSQITTAELLPGDVFNQAGFHVAMFTNLLQNGDPALIEAAGYNTHFNTFGGWSYVNGYIPRRFTGITGTTAGNPVGTTFNPIVIGSLPFSDSRNTATSLSSVYDGCNAAAATPEKGPELVYKIQVTTPGTLTATVQDDANTDVDVYLLEHLNTTACKARGDTTISQAVGCGTYYVIVDSYGTSAAKAGPYTLNVNVAPSGQSCAAAQANAPSPFSPVGKLGDACAYPGHEDLGFCNPNLGSETCIYGSTSSFCSKGCAQDSECSVLPGGGCCQDLGKGEKYCMTQSFCTGGTSSSGGATSSGGASSGGASSGGTGTGSDPGTGDGNGADPGSDPGPVATSDSGGGCGVAGHATSTWGLALAGLGIAAALRRRRR